MESTISGTKDMELEYDNSGRVDNAAELLDAYISDAAAYREKAAERADLDQTYGPKPRNKLDLFWPSKKRKGAIALFIHGGYWQKLDRTAFSHMAKGLNAHGVAVAIPSYTLCPDTNISGIIDELRRACIVLWKTYGGPITVFGHSAGGHLAACMLATNWNRIHKVLPENLVHSALAISGVFELAPLIQTSINDALKLSAEEAKTASPYNWLIEPGLRFDAWVGANESAEFLRQSKSQTQRWLMMGAKTRYQEIADANHFTAIDQLIDPESPMVKRLLELMQPAEELTLQSLGLAEPAVEGEAASPEDQDAPLEETNAKPTDLNETDDAPDVASADTEESPPVQTEEPETNNNQPDKSDIPAKPENEDGSKSDVEVSPEIESASDESGREDDLTTISGIGKVLQARLNDLGFSTFEQIGELTESQKEMIEEVLDFKDRIDQDHWITQARHLQALKEMAE